MSGNLIEITDTNFEKEVYQSNLPVLVDFWAEWCAPCRALTPTIEAIANERVGAVKVCKVNVDDSPNTAGQLGIRSIPTLILFKGGRSVGQLVGNVAKAAIEDFINRNG